MATVTNPGSFMATITHPTGNGYCRDRILRDTTGIEEETPMGVDTAWRIRKMPVSSVSGKRELPKKP